MNKELLDKDLDQPIKSFVGKAGLPETDAQFDLLYSPEIQRLSGYHWTPLDVVKKATSFLNTAPRIRILDIGCGVGKFCLAGACYAPQVRFFGVEQRKHLLEEAGLARKQLQTKNVTFIHANFTQLDFRQFDHFYFFNSFYENLDDLERIDDSIDFSAELFDYYNRYLYQRLLEKPAGTRVVTFHSLEDEIPSCYQVKETSHNDQLKCWIKTD